MPKSEFALTWTKLGEQYGPMTWLTIPGKPFLILNSLEVARELLEQRGFIYTDRPRFAMIADLVGLWYLTPLCRLDSGWGEQRTLLKHALSVEVVKRDYSPLFKQKTREYLECLLAQPESFLDDLKKVIAQEIVELTYGRLEDGRGNDFVQLNSHVFEIIDQSIQGYLVDLISSLQHLPSWLPGMKFKRIAAKFRMEVDEARQIMFQSVKEGLSTGDPNIKSSFILNSLQDLYQNHDGSKDVQELKEAETTIDQTGFSFYTAGAETVLHTTRGLLLAMVLFPSVQEKAQAEIDRVVGTDRLPTLEDEEHLPYLHALVLEALRWCPGAAAAIPHTSIKDDVYEGYFIPKGTNVVSNTWGFTRNPKYYVNPSKFDPERYLKSPPELDPREFVFGFGRRRCPGSELAFRAIWTMSASVLWAFRLRRVEGDTTPLDADSDRFRITGVCSTVEFKCQFTPRHENLREKLDLYVH